MVSLNQVGSLFTVPKKIVELIVPVLIYNSLLSGSSSWLSLLSHLRNGLLLSTFLLLLVLALNKKFVGLSGLGDEVLILGKQELEIDSCLIKKHTGNGWGKFFTEGLHNWHIDIVSNKVVSLISPIGCCCPGIIGGCPGVIWGWFIPWPIIPWGFWFWPYLYCCCGPPRWFCWFPPRLFCPPLPRPL